MSVNKYNPTTGELERIAGGTLYADAPLLTVVSSYDTVAAPGWKFLTTDVAGRTLSRTEYKELFDLVTERGLIGEGKPFGEGDGSTTFVLPDLRGEFIRGVGTNGHSGQGNGGTVGQHQDSTKILSDTIDTGKELCTAYINDSNCPSIINADTSKDSTSVNGSTYMSTSHSTTEKYIGYFAIRPTNTSLNYFMKVKQVALPADFESQIQSILSVSELPMKINPTAAQIESFPDGAMWLETDE